MIFLYIAYLLIMILLSVSGFDVLNDVRFPIFLGSIFSVFSAVMKVWRVVSR